MSLVRQGVTALSAAVALWLSLGVLAVVGASTAVRVGVLAPVWMFLLLVVLAAAAAWLIRAHRSSSLLWLPTLFLYLPWLPIVVPVACLLWVGPTASLIWVTIAVAVLWDLAPRTPSIASIAARLCQPTVLHPARAPVIAGLLAAAVYLFGAWQLSAILPGGDEPHYLVIADSLLHDADLQIENNHRAHQYLAYYHGELKPDYLRRGVNGQIYSIHAPGLPALLLPAYALFGYHGAVVFLALLSAMGSVLAWRLCWTLTGRPTAAWFGWAAAAFPVPVLFHASTIYPDGCGAVIVLTGAVALVSASRLTASRVLLHGAALAFLPWLHTRFVLLALALGLCITVRLAARPDRGRLIGAFLTVPTLSAAAWFSYFYVIYGTLDPSAPYGTHTQSALANVAPGLTGLLFDQQFGLIPNAPVYLVGLCALGWLMLRRARGAEGDARRLAIELAIVIAPYVFAAAMYGMWWGGSSAPARFLTPVLPLLAIAAALLWAHARTRTTGASAVVALTASLWLSAAMLLVQGGRLAYNDRDGFALWTDWANPTVDLARGMPSLFQTAWASALNVAAIWAFVMLMAWAALWAIEGRLARGASGSPIGVYDRRLHIFGIAAVPAGYALAVMMALTLSWNMTDASGLRSDFGQAVVFRDVQQPQWWRGIVYGGIDDNDVVMAASTPQGWWVRPRLVRPTVVPEYLRINSATRRVPHGQPLFFMPRLPAGRYRLIVETVPAFEVPPGGRLDVYIGHSTTPLRTFDIDSSPERTRQFELLLPIGAYSLVVRPDDRARRCVQRVVLEPRSHSGGLLDRLPGEYALQTWRYGSTSVYATSAAIYLEPGGFWVAPHIDADVLIEPDRPVPTITLLVRNGPVANEVELDGEAWHHGIRLDPGAETLVEVPASPRGATPLRIHAAAGFRPSELDPKNGDHRRLAVWVELR